MDTCSQCGHDDMVHFNWAGCCGHAQCSCEGNSTTTSRCRRDRHGEDCWWAYPRDVKVDEAALERQTAKILALHMSGLGTRKIALKLGVKRPLVMQTIHRESVLSVGKDET